MGLNSYANRRDDNERSVIQALRQIGAQVWQLDKPVDLLVEFRRKWVLVEVKSAKGKLTKAQTRFIEETEAPVFVAYGAEDAINKITTCCVGE